MSTDFQVKLTADFLQADGTQTYQDIGLALLDKAPDLSYTYFDTHKSEISPDQLIATDAIICLTPRVTKATLASADRLTMISRFGVGYDSVDVDACTDADVLLTITAGGVNYSVAEAVMTFMLAISHNLRIKDRLVRNGAWDERSAYMGSELRDRTLGIIGLGGIGTALSGMVNGFRMKPVIAFDPFLPKEQAAEIGVELVDLETLMQTADFVSINCPLTNQTRDLIGQNELALMKPTAYLINTARGGIVNEAALLDVLKNKQIAGAALDCHEVEPVPEDYEIAKLDNVILAPHAIAWTNEMFRDLGKIACQQTIDLSMGKIPLGVVNKAVLDKPGFQSKLNTYASRA
ncbi:MAG: dehydrogenase [Rhodospirillales bacterium]|jgi:phosphoglycerate dehydrogenase-like enzyme|nr:dehydrogenase [Rhodospirillales bacterium]